MDDSSTLRPLILVLEDEEKWQLLISDTILSMGFVRSEYEMVPSISEFCERWAKGKYKAVILDNCVQDGEALLRTDLPIRVRREDSDVLIAFNSLSEVSNLAATVGASNLRKDSTNLREFLYQIKFIKAVRPPN